jgi:protein-tyrosine phosphatase
MASARRRALAGRRGLEGRVSIRSFARGLTRRAGTLRVMRAPTWIERGRLLAGRHPCAWTPHDAPVEVGAVLDHGVTLFVDLTQEDELAPYESLVNGRARYIRLPVQDFTVPSDEQIVDALDLIDAELRAGGVVYVHCWAGCGRTGVIVGCWLVRHGTEPRRALARIAEARGLGCPQTLEQRLAILGWESGR